MRSMQRHWVLLIVGVVLDLVGTIWALQGVDALPGSFMSGQPFWAGAGAVMMAAGMVLIIVALRHKAEHG